MSIAEFGLRPQDSFTDSLPKMRLSRRLAESETQAKQYQALSRLSISLASLTPEDLSRNLAALLRPLLDFEFLDVTVFKEGTAKCSGTPWEPGSLPRQMFRSKKRHFGGFNSRRRCALQTGSGMIGSQSGERR